MIKSIVKFYKENGLILTIMASFSSLNRKLYNKFLSRKFNGKPKINIHPSSFIRGLAHIEVGFGFTAGRNLWLEAITTHQRETYCPQIIIGNNVSLSDSVHIASTNKIVIGNNVLMASKIYISDHNHGNYQGEDQSDPLVSPNLRKVSSNNQVVIEDDVWIGEFVSILPGTRIGKGSIIGSNSVVSKDIPEYSIAVGNPANVIKKFNRMTMKWEKM